VLMIRELPLIGSACSAPSFFTEYFKELPPAGKHLVGITARPCATLRGVAEQGAEGAVPCQQLADGASLLNGPPLPQTAQATDFRE